MNRAVEGLKRKVEYLEKRVEDMVRASNKVEEEESLAIAEREKDESSGV